MIILTSRYPTKSQADALNYALAGKARDVTSSGDGTGTPLEKDWMNDLFGWQQALMAQAGLAPNGNVETQIASQLLSAVQIVSQQRIYAAYQFGTTAVANNALFPILALMSQNGSFNLTANVVTFPAAGKYRVAVSGMVKSTSTTNPSYINYSLDFVSAAITFVSAQRATAVASDSFAVSYETLLDISNPATQKLSLKNTSGTTVSFSDVATALSNLLIERVA
jgi:hypothetical protein